MEKIVARELPQVEVVGIPITALRFEEQITQILTWAERRERRVVCVANVHMVMEANRDASFAEVLRQADMVTPDGTPLVWMMRCKGAPEQNRVTGFEILPTLCEQAAARKLRVFFLGSTLDVLDRMADRLQQEYPGLEVAGMISPPFRSLSPEEDERLVRTINDSRPHLVLVALGCPKQERWMDAHKQRIKAVQIGLGGAFPVFAGTLKRSPSWVQTAGLEWAYRLAQEPRRLWKRYWSTNLPFMWLAMKQLVRG